MNSEIKFKKCQFFLALFLIILISHSSCVSITKLATGLKSPKVLSIDEIRERTYHLFDNDSVIDLAFNSVKDSTEIIRIVSESFNGQVNVFDSDGKKICFNGKSSCSAYQFSEIEKNGTSAFVDCDSTDFSNSDFNKLNNLLLKTIDIKTNKSYSLVDFQEYSYIFIYYWSDFISNSKNTVDDYIFFQSKLELSDLNYTILRVNCDLRDDWGLKKDGILKLNFTKKENRKYELTYGKIPWKK